MKQVLGALQCLKDCFFVLPDWSLQGELLACNHRLDGDYRLSTMFSVELYVVSQSWYTQLVMKFPNSTVFKLQYIIPRME